MSSEKKVKIGPKTLKEILAFAGMEPYGLLELFNDNDVMKQQCKRASDFNQRTKSKLKYDGIQLKNKTVKLNLEGLRIDTEFKRLTVENIDLEGKLKTKDEEEKAIALKAVAYVFDLLSFTEEATGNAQMINTYLKKKFPETISAMGLDLKQGSGIALPDKKIILQGDPDFVKAGG